MAARSLTRRAKRRRGALLRWFLGAVAVSVVFAASAAAQVEFNWSQPYTVSSSGEIDSLACASTSACAATQDDLGGPLTSLLTLNPAVPGGASVDSSFESNVGSPAGLEGVACASSTQCTAIDYNGYALTFNPASPGAPMPLNLNTGQTFTVSCPTTNECVVVTQDAEQTFDPNGPAPTSSPTVVDSVNIIDDIACPSTTQCTVVGTGGDEVTFDPLSPGSPTPVDFDSTRTVDAIACISTSECVAVDTAGYEVTFDPQNATASSQNPALVGSGGVELLAVACSSASQCTAVDNGGSEIAFEPGTPESLVAGNVNSGEELHDIACPSVTECVTGGAGANTTGTVEVGFEPVPEFVTSGPPTISGVAQAGSLLSEAHGNWLNEPTGYTYQWEQCDASGANCTAIAGATGQTYLPATLEIGSTLRVSETASNPAGGSGAAAISAPTAAIAANARLTSTKTSGDHATVTVTCSGAEACPLTMILQSSETLQGKKLIAVSARLHKKHRHSQTVTVGSTTTTVPASTSESVTVKLNGTGRSLLAKKHSLPALLTTSEVTTASVTSVVATRSLTFKTAKKHHHRPK
jgi:hypothetical protein